MKLALASLLFAAPAMAFAPTGSFGVQNTALKMSTEAATEKVRCICSVTHMCPFQSIVHKSI